MKLPTQRFCFAKGEFRVWATWQELAKWLGVNFEADFVCNNGLAVRFGNPIFKVTLLPRPMAGVTVKSMELLSHGSTMSYLNTVGTSAALKEERKPLSRMSKTHIWERLCGACLCANSCVCTTNDGCAHSLGYCEGGLSIVIGLSSQTHLVLA